MIRRLFNNLQTVCCLHLSCDSMHSTEESTMRHLQGIAGIQAAITLLIFTLLLTAGGCSSAESTPRATPALTVAVVQVVQKDVPIYSEWIGTLDGSVNAD